MSLPRELLSQFVKVTKDEPKQTDNTVVYGRYTLFEGAPYVRLEGSELLTPIATTVDAKEGELIAIQIKDHTAVATGNATSPAARTDDVRELDEQMSDANTLVVYKMAATELDAIKGTFDTIKTKLGEIGKLEATEAQVDELSAKLLDVDTLNANEIKAISADINSLAATFGEFEDVEADDLNVLNAEIDALKSRTAEITNATIKYAYVDFANVGELAADKIIATSGMIRWLTADESYVTGALVGVKIKGDLIEAGTLKADRLIIKGSDGNYYSISTDFEALPGVEPVEEESIHGSTIVAHSITATQMQVTELAAFGATIGGFRIIGNNDETGVIGAIHSVGKGGVDSSNPGVYFGHDGQIAIGCKNSSIRFYKLLDESGNEVLDDEGNPTYKLAISADSIQFSSEIESSLERAKELTEHVKIGTLTDPKTGDENPCIELAEGDSDFKQVITNKTSRIMDGNTVITQMDADGIRTESVTIKGSIVQGQWSWYTHGKGNLGLTWMDVREAIE